MTWKTPPSLKWLIVKRSRLSGALQKLNAEQEALKREFDDLEARSAKLRRKLEVLDEVFELHDIRIDPTEIQPVTPSTGIKIFRQGEMSRQIFRALSAQNGWQTTSEIVQRMIPQVKPVEGVTHDLVQRAVRRRLRSLFRQGRVERRCAVKADGRHDGLGQSMWRLPGCDGASIHASGSSFVDERSSNGSFI